MSAMLKKRIQIFSVVNYKIKVVKKQDLFLNKVIIIGESFPVWSSSQQTFFIHVVAHGCGGVSVDDVEEEVCGVVVRLTGVSWETEVMGSSASRHVMSQHLKVEHMFVPISEKYSSTLCAGP